MPRTPRLPRDPTFKVFEVPMLSHRGTTRTLSHVKPFNILVKEIDRPVFQAAIVQHIVSTRNGDATALTELVNTVFDKAYERHLAIKQETITDRRYGHDIGIAAVLALTLKDMEFVEGSITGEQSDLLAEAIIKAMDELPRGTGRTKRYRDAHAQVNGDKNGRVK